MSDVINANELRIGNYIQSRVHPVYWCVEEILTEIVKVSTDMIGVEPNNRHYASIAWDLTPIPLTEDWLVKFGFEKKVTAEELYKNGNVIWKRMEFKMMFPNGINCLQLVVIHEKRMSPKIVYMDLMAIVNKSIISCLSLTDVPNYVHQLQNLYFALTGHELITSPSNQAVT